MTQDAATGGAPPGTMAYPSAYPQGGPPAMHGKVRDFGLTVLLTIVTLGIYHFVYHWMTHDELSKQMGRENNNVVAFILYIVILFLFSGFGIIPFIFLVLNQYRLIEEARVRLGLEKRNGAGYFFALYIGASLIAMVVAVFFFATSITAAAGGGAPETVFGTLFVGLAIAVVAAIAMEIAAYYNLVTQYNEIWGTIQAGAHLPTDQEVAAYGGGAPGAPANAAGGYGMPSSSWDQQQGYAPQSGYAPQPGYTPQGQTPPVPPAGASEPPRGGYSVQSRAPAGTQMVEQAFQCPRCHAHVAARGVPGTDVTIKCNSCGEGGSVRLPEA